MAERLIGRAGERWSHPDGQPFPLHNVSPPCRRSTRIEDRVRGERSVRRHDRKAPRPCVTLKARSPTRAGLTRHTCIVHGVEPDSEVWIFAAGHRAFGRPAGFLLMSSVRRTGPPAQDTTSRFSLSPLEVLDDLSSGELFRVTEGPERCPGPYQPDTPNTSSNMFKSSQRLASGRMKRRVFTTHSRWISSAKAEISDVQVFLRLRNEVGGWAELIIYSTEVPQVIGTAMICRLSECRRSNRSGQKYHST
jgi:hypothetical protein